MGAQNQTALLVGVGIVVAVLVVAALLAVVRSAGRTRRRLDEAHAEAEGLRARLDELSQRLEDQSPARKGEVEFVITDAGDVVSTDDLTEVPDRLVLTATLGEPLVKVAAFGHGVRRALSTESRNRIWFEMRREVRANRKRRRRELKAAIREARATDRSVDAA